MQFLVRLWIHGRAVRTWTRTLLPVTLYLAVTCSVCLSPEVLFGVEFSGDDFRKVLHTPRLPGTTVDTFSCQSPEALENGTLVHAAGGLRMLRESRADFWGPAHRYRARASSFGETGENERLFGHPFEPKVIVSMGLGHSVLFSNCVVARRTTVPSSICLDHGDNLVMDGPVQSECEHCTAYGLQGHRVRTVGQRNTLRPVHLQEWWVAACPRVHKD